jgi:hypothetical protein
VGTVLLVACFLFGPGAWVIRNQVQVHRTELVDSLMSDSVVIATLNGQNFSAPLYVRSQDLAFDPHTTQAQRVQFHQQFDDYAKHMVLHEPFTVAEQQATYYLEAFFPVPIYGVTYTSSLLFLERMAWSVLLLGEYFLAVLTAVKWWAGAAGTSSRSASSRFSSLPSWCSSTRSPASGSRPSCCYFPPR